MKYLSPGQKRSISPHQHLRTTNELCKYGFKSTHLLLPQVKGNSLLILQTFIKAMCLQVKYPILYTLDISRHQITRYRTQHHTTSKAKFRSDFELTKTPHYPHISPSLASYGCHSWGIWRQLTARYRERTVFLPDIQVISHGEVHPHSKYSHILYDHFHDLKPWRFIS